MKRSIIVIINPIAGVRPKDEIPAIVHEVLPDDQFDVQIRYTEYAGHASEIAKEAVRNGIDSVVAIGGDGTINETAKSLINSETALGIVPMGSGNGLARHIQIPLEITRALQVVKEGHREKIDYGDVDGHIFFCTTGVGFDAMVSKKFAEIKGRGPINYAKSVVDVISNFDATTYSLYTDDGKYNEKAFLIAIGNAAQWGNNAFITPRASMTDGLLDITLVKPFPLIDGPQLAMQLFTRTIDENPHVETFRSQNVRIVLPKANSVVHVDGEPITLSGVLHIGIHPKGLYVLTPAEPMSNVLEPIQYALEDIHYSILNNLKNVEKTVGKTVEKVVVEPLSQNVVEPLSKAVAQPIELLKKRVTSAKKKPKK